MEVAQDLQIHRSNLRRDNADRDEADRAAEARRVRQDTVARETTQKYGELISGVSSLDELRELPSMLGGAPEGSAPGPGSDRLYRVWYATNRRPNRDHFEASYGARLDDRVHFGSCDVVIPASHRIGELGSPWIRRILARTDDRLRLHEVVPMGAESFWAGVRQCAASFPAEHRHALVFIHGFRVSFKDAALRAAQLGYDLGVKGPVAFFSWPSRATLIGYPADGSAAEASEGAISEFLIQFARDCGADRVHVIAHSMGNRPLLRALQRIVSPAQHEHAVRFGHLVLAAPDLTRELFLDLADEYRRLSHRTTLYVSHLDRALRASFRLHGPRVGLAPPVTCVPGIDTVHVANVDRTLLGHSTFAEARPVLYDIHALLNYDAPPGLRAGLIERQQGDERYWEVRA
jgi:esterase/lipase superfamily enzyme